jgi:hypothetical protein
MKSFQTFIPPSLFCFGALLHGFLHGNIFLKPSLNSNAKKPRELDEIRFQQLNPSPSHLQIHQSAVAWETLKTSSWLISKAALDVI